jgi:hypothetical protein
MLVEIKPDEQLAIRVGDRVWLFDADNPNEVWLHAASNGRKIYADVFVTRSVRTGSYPPADEGDGVRLNVTGDP